MPPEVMVMVPFSTLTPSMAVGFARSIVFSSEESQVRSSLV